MMKKYSTPMIMIEEFTVNHTVADCGDKVQNITGEYECLTGNVKDTGTAFSTSCARPCAVFSGYSKAKKLGGKEKEFSNVDGLIAYCTKGQNSTEYVGTSEWYTEGDTVYHKNSHSMQQQYHCMVRGITEKEVKQRLS